MVRLISLDGLGGESGLVFQNNTHPVKIADSVLSVSSRLEQPPAGVPPEMADICCSFISGAIHRHHSHALECRSLDRARASRRVAALPMRLRRGRGRRSSASSRRSPQRRRPPQAHVDRTGVSECHWPRRERGPGTWPNQRLR
jgi:hypothetical protein